MGSCKVGGAENRTGVRSGLWGSGHGRHQLNVRSIVDRFVEGSVQGSGCNCVGVGVGLLEAFEFKVNRAIGE